MLKSALKTLDRKGVPDLSPMTRKWQHFASGIKFMCPKMDERLEHVVDQGKHFAHLFQLES